MRRTSYANRGRFLESMIDFTNEIYKKKGIGNVQKIPIPVTILKEVRGKIVSGYRKKKSTLDYRGTIAPGIPVSFDAKETKNEEGLPLANIQEHQIEFMRQALELGEVSFIICHLSTKNKTYLIPGETVIKKWKEWQENKGKRGYNTISTKDMIQLKSRNGVPVDYEHIVFKIREGGGIKNETKRNGIF